MKENNSNTKPNNNNKLNNKKNISSNKKNKVNSFQKYSLCFPFNININVIQNEHLINNILNNLKNWKNYNSMISFGLNSSLKILQTKNKEEKLIFLFYNKKMTNLYDIILFRSQLNENIKIYFLDNEYIEKFLEIFKIKKCLSFCVTKNNLNANNFDEIKNICSSYNCNANSDNINLLNITPNKKLIKEITITKQ